MVVFRWFAAHYSIELLLSMENFHYSIQVIKHNKIMEDELFMNRLPLPVSYNGTQWNSIIKPSRRCIPKYLHDQLPKLKFIAIRQKFKAIDHIQCPKLDYFNDIIKSNTSKASHKIKGNPTRKIKNFQRYKTSQSHAEIQDQFQYALLFSDDKSNIVDELVVKARQLQRKQLTEKSQNQKIRNNNWVYQRSKNRRMSAPRENGNYFSNTVNLIFRNRRQQYSLSTSKENDRIRHKAYENIKHIKSLDSNEN